MNLRWLRREVRQTCPVCGAQSAEIILSAIDDGRVGTTNYTRCLACRSLSSDRLLSFGGNRAPCLSYYLEKGAAIDIMVEPLLRVTAPRRFLEIGCGFGFALDFARQMLGLHVCGVDSGIAASVGAHVLGLPIHRTAFTADLDLGGPFDLVLASEVVEHIETPVQFLRDVRGRMTADGLLRLTTPDAANLGPQTQTDVLMRGLSPGHHAVLFTQDALKSALERVGLSHITWDSVPDTLRCWASPTADGLKRLRELRPEDRNVFPQYLAQRADDFPPGSALELGLRYRYFKTLINAGRHVEAEASLPAFRRSIKARHGIDFTKPECAAASLAPLNDSTAEELDRWPFCIPGAFFFLGILELNSRLRPEHAEAAFTASANLLEPLVRAEQAVGIHDGESADLLGQARLHRLIPVCRRAPDVAVREFTQLLAAPDLAEFISPSSVSRCRAQLLMEAVHSGGFDAAATLAPAVVAELGGFVDSLARANVLLALESLAINNADSARRAREYLLDATAKCDSTSFTNAKVQIS